MDRTTERPDFVDDEILATFDELRENAVDIGAAQAHVSRWWGLSRSQAEAAALY
jgi:hypothetical protein